LILREEKRDLFTVDKKYCFAHCISADYALGAGIAVQFQKRFKLKNKLKSIGNGNHPECLNVDGVFNLVTKAKYSHKPTYNSLKESLIQMRDIMLYCNCKYVAMPKIGCGLDRLQWGKVREIIKEVFKDTAIEILVCRL